MLTVVCPSCGTNHVINTIPAGGRARCSKCATVIDIEPTPKRITGKPGIVDAEYEVTGSSDLAEEYDPPAIYPEWESGSSNRNIKLVLLSLAIPTVLVVGLVVVAFQMNKKPAPPAKNDIASRQRQPTNDNIERAPPQRQPKPLADNSKLNAPSFPPLERIPEVEPQPRNAVADSGNKSRPEAPVTPKPTEPIAPVPEAGVSKALLKSLITELAEKKNTSAKRIKTAETIGGMGAQGRDASDALCLTMLDKNGDVARAANEALEKVNPQLHAIAITMAVETNRTSRIRALSTATNLGDEGHPLVPLIMNLRLKELAGNNIDIAPNAIPVLASIAKNDQAVLKVVAGWLASNQHMEAREAAAKAIPLFNTGKDYVPNLIQSIKADPAPQVQLACINSLAAIGPDARKAEPVLKLCKTHSVGAIREAAKRAIEAIGAND